MNNSNTASNWPEIPIGKTGQVLGGRQRSPHATGSPQKYLRVANVFDGYIDSSDVFEMPFSEEESKRFLLAPGDILLNEGQSLELVGRSAVYRGDPPNCCFQNTLIRYRANSDVLPEFAQYTFQNFLRLGKFAAIASQTTSIAHLGTGRFAALPMPVPPLDEQRAIASALSDTDALLAKLDQLIAKKRDIKQAAMQKMLSGHGNQHIEQWTQVRLGEIFSFKNGLNKAKEYFGHGTPIINYMDVYANNSINASKINGKVMVDAAELKAYDVQRGDVFFTRTSETVDEIAASAVVLGETASTVFSGFLLRARSKNSILLDEFKVYCFQARYVRSQITSTSSYTTRALTNGRLLSNVMALLHKASVRALVD